MRTAKTLIRLGGCPGWSKTSLMPFCWFCHEAAHMAFNSIKTYSVVIFWPQNKCPPPWILKIAKSYGANQNLLSIHKKEIWIWHKTHGKILFKKSICYVDFREEVTHLVVGNPIGKKDVFFFTFDGNIEYIILLVLILFLDMWQNTYGWMPSL